MSYKFSNLFAKNEVKSIDLISEYMIEFSHRVKISKAYLAYFDSYKNIDKVIDFLNSILKLCCIGRIWEHI